MSVKVQIQVYFFYKKHREQAVLLSPLVLHAIVIWCGKTFQVVHYSKVHVIFSSLCKAFLSQSVNAAVVVSCEAMPVSELKALSVRTYTTCQQIQYTVHLRV